MKSTFFHVGVNKTMEREEGLRAPRIKSDGSIEFIPLPAHHDPDLDNLTYGDPFGRLERFEKGDIAWFIESVILDRGDWGYFLMTYFVIEDMYYKHDSETWNKSLRPDHADRIAKNAHEIRGDTYYAIILGDREKSHVLLNHPFRLSEGEDPYPLIKSALGFPERSLRGYWYKKWFLDSETTKLLKLLVKHVNSHPQPTPLPANARFL